MQHLPPSPWQFYRYSSAATVRRASVVDLTLRKGLMSGGYLVLRPRHGRCVAGEVYLGVVDGSLTGQDATAFPAVLTMRVKTRSAPCTALVDAMLYRDAGNYTTTMPAVVKPFGDGTYELQAVAPTSGDYHFWVGGVQD